MIRNLFDLIKTTEGILSYLKGKKVRFDKKGFPVLPKRAFLNSWPEQIVPYDFRKSRLVQNPSKTLLCFYCADKRIYPRFEKVLDEIVEYRRFMGVVVMDNAKPFGKNPVLQNFYRMRKGQIFGWLRKMLPGKKIFYFSERISTKSV